MRYKVAVALSVLATVSSAAAGKLSTLDVHAEYRPDNYQNIGEAVGDSTVVALGESIHLTREMPLVRLGVLRYLHEEKGFNVLALEGAMIDIWTAQENAYRSRQPLSDRTRSFARQALFGLWQTDQMEQVIGYALITQKTANPLYMASFDIQPGTARAYGGSAEGALKAFIALLRNAGARISQREARAVATALGPALNCQSTLPDLNDLNLLEQTISQASATLQKSRPPIHVDTLRLVPAMVRRRLQHCRQVASGGSYQATRDEHNAALVTYLVDRSGKIVLWAHHSHVHHNSLGKAVPSMGQHLKRLLGDRLYTIGVFAAGGTGVDSTRLDSAQGPGIVFALASRPLPEDERFDAERRLALKSADDFFMDLRSQKQHWAQPSTTRMEVDLHQPTALSRDFDGAILLHQVSGAELNFLPAPFRFAVRLAGWVLQHRIVSLVLLALVAVGIIGGVRGLVRRRRSRRHQPAGA
jgi:erythromycin esterase-like protein